MNNICNKFVDKETTESMINKYIDIYYENMEKKWNDEDIFKLDSILFPDKIPSKNKKHIKINSIQNIQKAFIHKSFWNVNNIYDETDAYACMFLDKKKYGNYEQSELNGDKVIDLITLDYLIDKFPDKDEGFISDTKSRIVRKESLAVLGEKLNFKEYILFSSHIDRITKKDTGRDNKRFLEDVFESFIGELYIDQNKDISIIKPFLLGVYYTYIDIDYIIKNDINYKTLILKYFNSKKYGHPKYTDLYFIGPVTQREFISIILLDNSVFIDNCTAKNIENVKKKKKEILESFNNELLETIKSQPKQVTLNSTKFLNIRDFESDKNVSIDDIVKQLESINLKELNNEKNKFLNLLKMDKSYINKDANKDTNETPPEFLNEILKTHVVLGLGRGTTIKMAEQDCSKDCLELLEQL